MTKLKRTAAQWGAMNPTTVAQRHSRNVVKATLVEAKHDLLVLHRRVETLLDAVVTTVTPVHLNPAGLLPPVGCPLLIKVAGHLEPAERTGIIADKGSDMEYRLADGLIIHGRFPWTYP